MTTTSNPVTETAFIETAVKLRLLMQKEVKTHRELHRARAHYRSCQALLRAAEQANPANGTSEKITRRDQLLREAKAVSAEMLAETESIRHRILQACYHGREGVLLHNAADFVDVANQYRQLSLGIVELERAIQQERETLKLEQTTSESANADVAQARAALAAAGLSVIAKIEELRSVRTRTQAAQRAVIAAVCAYKGVEDVQPNWHSPSLQELGIETRDPSHTQPEPVAIAPAGDSGRRTAFGCSLPGISPTAEDEFRRKMGWFVCPPRNDGQND